MRPGCGEGQRQLLLALLEAVRSPVGGDVVVRAGRDSARVHVTGGRIAWANVSTLRTTFSERLTRRGLIGLEDLRDVLAHCRQTGENFAETAIAWGLVTEPMMRAQLRDHVVSSLAEAFRLPGLQCVFSPIRRTYAGRLLFPLEEVLDGITSLDEDPPELLCRRRPGEAAADFLDRVDLERALGDPETPPGPSIDVQVLAGLSGLLAASVTNGRGEAGVLGSFGGRQASDATPYLDVILATANHATAITGLGNVVGLWLCSPEGNAVVQEFSEGGGLVRCIFAPGTNAALLRLKLERLLTEQDSAA